MAPEGPCLSPTRTGGLIMAIPGSDRRTAPLKTISARRTPPPRAASPLLAAPASPRSSALHPLPRRHPRAMPRAVASSSPRIEAALMLALPRNPASTIAHVVAQCWRRNRVGVAANIAPCVAHYCWVYCALVALLLRSTRAVHAHAARLFCAVSRAYITLCFRHACARHAR